eukprot:4071918-Amphidinium_carterae.1
MPLFVLVVPYDGKTAMSQYVRVLCLVPVDAFCWADQIIDGLYWGSRQHCKGTVKYCPSDGTQEASNHWIPQCVAEALPEGKKQIAI